MFEASSVTRPIRARAATVSLFLASGAGIGAWAACIPAIKGGLRLSDSALGVALLAFAAGAIFAMPSAGWLGVRFGSHRVAIAAGCLFAGGLLFPGMASNLPVLIGVALFLGMGNGVLDVAMNAHATAVERGWGRPIMSSFHAAFSLGGLSGAALAGVLLAQGLPVSASLATMAAIMAALIATAVRLGATTGLPILSSNGSDAAFAWPSRAQVGFGALAFLTMLIEGGMTDWAGVFLVSAAGATIAAAAFGYGTFSVAMVVGRALGDRIVLALGDVRVVRCGALLVAAGLSVTLTSAQPTLAAIGFGLVGLGVANMVPVLFSAAGRSRPDAPSVGVAMAATLGYAGFLVGPPVIGLVADVVGLRLAMMILLAGAGLIVLLAGTILRPSLDQRAASRRAT